MSMKSEWKLCLFRYSPLHTLCQVKAQCREYPATLLLTGDHDDRVVPLHSLKFIAELQHVLGTAHQQVPNVVVLLSLLLLLCPPPYGRGAISDTAIHLSVCLSHGAAVQAIGMLAACSLATAGHQRCADCGPDGHRSAAVFATVELPSAGRGAYCISAPGATPCLTGLFGYIFHRQLCSCGRKWDIQWHV